MKLFLRAAAMAGAVTMAAAQPIPKFNSISQDYVQRGSTIEFTIAGENIAGAKFLFAGGAGLKLILPPPPEAQVTVESSGGGIRAVTQSDPNRIVAKLEIAADAILGAHELRLATAAGVSNPQTINVSHLPEFREEGGTTLENPRTLPLPFAISAKIGGGAETDFYRFAAKKGQRVVLEVLAQRIGSELDSSLAIFDKAGHELARNEDAMLNDSVLEFVAPDDGEFVAQVRDYRMRGGDNFKYRLLAGAMPYVIEAFPYGGRRGEMTTIELRGYNLQGAEKMALQLDANARSGRQELRTSTAMGLSNPFAFDVTDLPQVMEAEPNTSLTHANAISLPAAINGRIQNPKDYDAFRFHAEKDQRFVFEVMAARHGSALDALLTLTDADGNVLQKNDDAGSADARIDQTFGAAGDYYVFIEDLLERGGPNFGYRINCYQPSADFEVKFVNDTPRVPRGGRVPIRCEVARLNNFSEPLRIVAKNLPAGLHAEPLLITVSDPPAGLVFVSASEGAELGNFPIELEAISMIGGKAVKHAAKAFAGDRGVKQGYITVLDSAPFLVHSAQLLATAEQDQSFDVQALIERGQGFNGEVKISLEGFSAGREPVTRSFDYQPVTIKGNESQGTLKLKTKLDSEIGARMVVLRGDASVGGQPVTQYSAPFPVATTQVPFLLSTTLKRVVLTALPSGSQSSAGEAVFNVRAERRAGFGGEITLQIEGVPAGVTVTADKIPANAGEAPVKLVASDKAAVGKEVNLTLTGVGTFREKTYRFKPAAVKLLVNAPEPVEIKTAEAKPPAETAASAAK